MSHQLVLDIPDELYQRVVQQAQQAGKKPEELISAWIARALRLQQDALRRRAGAFQSGVPDAALRHHEYLGQAFQQELQDKKDG